MLLFRSFSRQTLLSSLPGASPSASSAAFGEKILENHALLFK